MATSSNLISVSHDKLASAIGIGKKAERINLRELGTFLKVSSLEQKTTNLHYPTNHTEMISQQKMSPSFASSRASWRIRNKRKRNPAALL